MNRRTALRVLVSTGAVAVLAACGAPPPAAAPTVKPAAPPPAPAATAASAAQVATPPKPAANQPRSGGTLRTAISGDPASLDGHLFAAGRFDTTWLIYDRLTEYDLNVNPQPRLAESWELSSDAKRL